MDKIPSSAYTRLLNEARITNKQIYLGASGRGVIPQLRGARQWQLENTDNHALQGVILLSPNLFIETPDPGLSGQLMPIASATNLPIVLLQPEKSPYFWKLDQTTTALRRGGSNVMTWRLANLRDRFYFRPDADDTEKDAVDLLWQTIADAIDRLALRPAQSHPAVTKLATPTSVREGKKDRVLSPYRGNPVPPRLRLPTLDNQTVDLSKLRGKVVIVNFWASWCPPCVYEMPSMQRLQDSFADQPFVILGVNMAEEEAPIRKFVDTTVRVRFPILLDKNGAALKRWKVFAFPTSYVIDKKGRIRYALFGGLDWDTPDITHKIRNLLAEP
jgi:thiol-disulfide isomerase/thioredoxin